MTFGERFLRYPDLFPARAAGEPWGDESFVVDLPAGPYEVSDLAPAQREAMELRYGASLPVPERSRGGIRMFHADPDDFLSMGPPGWEYTLDIDCTESIIRIAAPNFMARLDRGAPTPSGAVWTPEGSLDEFINVIENVLRPLLAWRLVEAGGLLLHSCGVVIGGRSFLFVGRSGAGKSTVAGLALERGHRVLSDDLNVLEFEDGAWRSRRLPFAGTHQGAADSQAYPVAGLVRLQQAPEHRIEPATSAALFGLALTAAPFVNTIDGLKEPLEAVALRLAEDLPGWVLSFRKDGGFWPLVEAM